MTTLAELVENESVRRREFPICEHKIYFAHASVAPLPARAAEAMKHYIDGLSREAQDVYSLESKVDEARARAALLIGAHPEEIALLGPTSVGLSLVAQGVDWRPGDEVVCYPDDYPANVYAWFNLRRRGVKIISLQPERLGYITPELIAASISPRTRLVALSSCHFVTGYRLDVAGVGAVCREQDVLFSLDGIQTLGAFVLSARDVDFISAGAQKWMLGPEGTGIFYVKKARFETLAPTLIGGWNVRSENSVAASEIQFFETARRYEPGVLNACGMIGMAASLELLEQIGQENVSARILGLNAALLDNLESLGFVEALRNAAPDAAGILTVSHPRVPSERVVGLLAENGVVVSLRHDREGNGYVRFSPHFYNTLDEVERVGEILKRNLPV